VDLAGHVSSGRHLYRSNTQGREDRRPASRAINKLEFVINLKTAEALGIEVPQLVENNHYR
jgi:hypothetical protein